MIKNVLKSLFDKIGYQIIKKKTFITASYKNMDSDFPEIFEKCKNYTITSKERMYALYNAINYIVANDIPGDLVECGVWRGGSAMLCAYTLKKIGITNRKIYLYDTFRGMSQPTEKDRESFTEIKATDEWKKQQKGTFNAICYVPLNEVKDNMYSTNYPEENIIFVEGKVEDTIPDTLPDQISLLRLDTDWYESTIHELKHLYPILSKHGVIIIDDYGYWAGAKEAVDAYFQENKIDILLNRIDETGRIAVKLI